VDTLQAIVLGVVGGSSDLLPVSTRSSSGFVVALPLLSVTETIS
jgi:undecaprenyl pyrophosphate phosphatase UppP